MIRKADLVAELVRARGFARLWKSYAKAGAGYATRHLVAIHERQTAAYRHAMMQTLAELSDYQRRAGHYRLALEAIADSNQDGVWCRLVAERALRGLDVH